MTAVLGAASLASASAQTVYSVNAVGYVNVTVPANKFALLANPLNAAANTIAGVLPDAPANTVVYVYNAATSAFSAATKRASGSWTGTATGDTALVPGQGFFVKAPATDLTITFVGEVPQGNLSTPYVAGYNLLGSQVPQTGLLETDLGFKGATNDKAFIFDVTTQAYTTFTKRASGSWTGGPTGVTQPTVNVANGFFLNAAAAGTWTRTFSVN